VTHSNIVNSSTRNHDNIARTSRQGEHDNNFSNQVSADEVGRMLQSFKDHNPANDDHILPTTSIPSFHQFHNNATPNLVTNHLLQPLNDMHDANVTSQTSSTFSPSFYKFSPLDYSSNSNNLDSELASFTDPTARTTEQTRLWWTSNFKKEGWKRILNKPNKPANISRSIWQTIAFNQFMELTLLSQQSIATFSKDALSQDYYNDFLEIVVTVRSQNPSNRIVYN
jgi:hypothetical protein